MRALGLPEVLQAKIKEWATKYRRRNFSIDVKDKFITREDAHYTAVNLSTGNSITARAGGEWAGVADFMPNKECPIPQGNAVIETEIFLGVRFLTVFYNPVPGIYEDTVPDGQGGVKKLNLWN